MKIITMKLADLIKPEKNVRIHTEQQLKEFRRSIKMFGQIRPIVVDENNVILAGNGLYDTLISMGAETADVYKYDNLTENQKKKLMIADNKIFSLGIENLDTLNSFLEDLSDDLDIPGFDEEILKQMVSEAEDVTEKLSEYGTLDDEEIENIKKKTYSQPILETNTTENEFNDEKHIENKPIIATNEFNGKSEELAEVQKFIICPKCGEKIWL